MTSPRLPLFTMDVFHDCPVPREEQGDDYIHHEHRPRMTEIDWLDNGGEVEIIMRCPACEEQVELVVWRSYRLETS